MSEKDLKTRMRKASERKLKRRQEAAARDRKAIEKALRKYGNADHEPALPV